MQGYRAGLGVWGQGALASAGPRCRHAGMPKRLVNCYILSADINLEYEKSQVRGGEGRGGRALSSSQHAGNGLWVACSVVANLLG